VDLSAGCLCTQVMQVYCAQVCGSPLPIAVRVCFVHACAVLLMRLGGSLYDLHGYVPWLKHLSTPPGAVTAHSYSTLLPCVLDCMAVVLATCTAADRLHTWPPLLGTSCSQIMLAVGGMTGPVRAIPATKLVCLAFHQAGG
jgi:hypothetical protein